MIARIITVFLIKFCSSVFDISTDINAGINYLNRNFGLTLYYLSEPGDTDVSLYGKDVAWGLLTILVIWVPGTVAIGLRASEKEWRQMTQSSILKHVIGYLLLFAIWPFFSPLL